MGESIGRLPGDITPWVEAYGEEVLICAGDQRAGEDLIGLLMAPAAARHSAVRLAQVADEVDRQRGRGATLFRSRTLS